MRPTEFIRQVTSGKPGLVYFLRGPDRFMHDECRAAVISAVPPEARAWCLAEVEFESGQLGRQLDNAHQIPMLARHSYLLFSDPEDLRRAGDNDVEALEDYLNKPSPCATLVFVAVEPDRRRRFIQLLEKNATVVELRPPDRHEAAHWLEQYLRRAGVSIEPELAEQVAARFEDRPDPRRETKPGVNLLGLRTEVEKVLTARPDARRWEENDLDHIMSFREDHEINRLLEAISERQLARALGCLRALLASREPEALILWSIGDLFRQALKSAASAGRGGYGSGYAGGWQRSGKGSTFEIAQRAAKRYSPEELGQALRRTHDTDLAVKSSWKDSRVLIEILIWQVTVGKAGSGWAEPSWAGGADA